MSPGTAESVSTLMQATGWMRAAGFCSSFGDLEGFVFLLSCFVVVVLSLFVAAVLERFSVCLLVFEVFWIAGWGFIWLVLLFLPNFLPTLFFYLLQMGEESARGRETSASDGKGSSRKGREVPGREVLGSSGKGSSGKGREGK